MTKTRKRVTMLVTISIPTGYSAADARREVRSLVAEQCNYAMDRAELKLISVCPSKSTKKHYEQFAQRFAEARARGF